MKSSSKSETVAGIIFSIVISILFIIAFLWATEPEQWYAGQHDSHCEKNLDNEPCHCYERLIKAEKENFEK